MRVFSAFLLLLATLLAPACFGADGGHDLLDEKIVNLVSDAVYEVVVEKPTVDSLQYEKPLPLDLLPYSVRTSNYIPIGSAFAIGPDQFISAVHVLNPGYKSQYKGIFLRDREGKVYSIDKVVKFSKRRDFIVFSLKGKKAEKYLKINSSPKINQRVFAVGDALGDGIVIRDGLYTSNTPEEEAGEWNYIRFSAAASPGNSGGPLLDKSGKVVGIILGKSENENLNYALPIGDIVNADTKAGAFKIKGKYFIDNMGFSRLETIDRQIPLPMPYDQFSNELLALYQEFAKTSMNGFFKEYEKEIFPRGNSQKLLHTTYEAVFPGLIARGEDGNWDAYFPAEKKTADVGKNSFVTYGTQANYLFLQVQKPENIDIDTFSRDSKLFMDTLLKAITINRQVGPEKVKVISLGKAQQESVHVDAYGRKWFLRVWPVEYADEKIAAICLPVPGGMIAIMRGGETDRVEEGFLPDMKALTDFMYVSYYGTLKEWQEFLKMKPLIPPQFETVAINFNFGKRFEYNSKRIAFSYGNDLMQITERSDLKLLFSFFEDRGKVAWDVAGVVVGEDKNTLTSFELHREALPPEESDDDAKNDWENLIHKKYPYNRTVINNNGATSIWTSHGVTSGPKVAYSVGYGREGTVAQTTMKGKLEKFLQNVTVKETAAH